MENSDYQCIEQAIRFLDEYAPKHPSLAQVAEHVGLSPFHFQSLFKRWAGVSPKRFLQHLTVSRARQLLRSSASVLDTSLEVGLSGPGRLHDLLVSIDAVSPSEFKPPGKGLEIRYSFHPTPFGECLAAISPRGLCSLDFVESRRDQALENLRANWQEATLIEDLQASHATLSQVFAAGHEEPTRVLLKGTNFQLKVWEALLKIPEGAVVSYGTLAESLGQSSASRAVGNAVGLNPIAYLIPCHRVLRSSGELGGYRWGAARKRAILTRETLAGEN